MPQLSRRISVTALAGAGTGTTIVDANSVGGLAIPQKGIDGVYLRCLGGIAIDWRGPAPTAGLANAKLTIPGGEVGFMSGASLPGDIELFLPVGVSVATEVQVLISYNQALA